MIARHQLERARLKWMRPRDQILDQPNSTIERRTFARTAAETRFAFHGAGRNRANETNSTGQNSLFTRPPIGRRLKTTTAGL
jgi:hypothetical protein